MRALTIEDFSSAPVDIETFINDPHYLGGVMQGLYPYWVKNLKTVFPDNVSSSVCEVMLTGALGTGKTTAAVVGFLYDLYKITMLDDPHKKWAILPSTSIVLSVIALAASKSFVSDVILDAINLSPYFKGLLLPGKGGSLEIDMFPHKVGIEIQTRKQQVLGRAVMGSLVDDTGIKDERDVSSVVENYESTFSRSYTRFSSEFMEMPVRMWLTSSASSLLDGFVWTRAEDPRVAVFSPAVWEAQAHKGIYSGNTFLLFIGSETEEPCIVKDASYAEKYKSRIMRVPVEYISEFERNMPMALRELAGVYPKN